MPVPYSLDLRQRVIAAHDEGRLNPCEIAELYRVGESTIYEWLKLRAATKSLAPKPHTRGRRSELDVAVLDEMVAAENDRTLAEYATAYAGRTVRRYSIAQICCGLQQARLRRKKIHYEPERNSGMTSLLGARPTKPRSGRFPRKTSCSSMRAA